MKLVTLAALLLPCTTLPALFCPKKPTAHDAVRDQSVELLRTLINEGEPIDLPDKEKFTPVQRAAQKGLANCMYLLIEAGANQAMLFTIKCVDGQEKLKEIIAAGRELYIRRGVQLNQQKALIADAIEALPTVIVALINSYLSIHVPSQPELKHFGGCE